MVFPIRYVGFSVRYCSYFFGSNVVKASRYSSTIFLLASVVVDIGPLLRWTSAVSIGRCLPRCPGYVNELAVTTFKDLPLAIREREWDADAAERRVRKRAEAEDKPNAKYRSAFLWYDADNKDNFG